MQTRRRPRLGPLALLVSMSSLPSCSLMGLDEFGDARCMGDADCTKAEAQLRPSASACGHAVCVEGRCQWPEPHETCNGRDDDCNGLIDDGLVPPAVSVNSGGPLSADVAYAVDWPSGNTFVAVAKNGVGQGFMLGADGPLPTSDALQYQSSLGSGCPKREIDSASGALASCNFAEIALAADDLHLVVASINTNGCAEGQLRVGLSDLAGSVFSVWLGKTDVQSEDASNIAFGVDIDDDRGCTVASRDSTGEITATGATLPAVATLGTQAGGEGSLLAWLAASATPPQAAAAALVSGSRSIPVEALGLVSSSERPEWLTGSDQGRPTVLGRTTSHSAPAVLALKSTPGAGRFLVAFPTAQGGELGIQLFSLYLSKYELHYEKALVLTAEAADDVSLALGNTERAEVGVAWRSGTGADAQLNFTLISSSPPWTPLGTIVTWPAPDPPEPRIAPQLFHQGAGFANDEPTGGWFLSWVEGAASDAQTTQLARLRDETFERLNPGASHSDVHARALLYPSATDGVSSIGTALIRPALLGKTEIETTPAWCQ